MIHIKQLLFMSVGLLLLLASCSSSRLVSTWEDTTLRRYLLGRVLVVGVAKNETKRRIYEDTFTDTLKKAGVDSVASYTFSETPLKPDEQELKNIIIDAKVSAVLITHLVPEEKEAPTQADNVTIDTDSLCDLGLYGYYPSVYNSVYGSKTVDSATRLILETTIFDIGSRHPIWIARSLSIDPVMTKKYYQQLIDLFVADLNKRKMLPNQ